MKNLTDKLTTSLLTILFVAGFCFYAQAQTPCPTNFNGQQLSMAQKNVQGWKNKIVAFELEVQEVHKGYEGAPYFLAKLNDGSTIWVATLVISGYIKKGAKLTAIGYFKPMPPNDEMATVNHDGYYVMAFATKDNASGRIGVWPRENEKVQQWFDGVMPE